MTGMDFSGMAPMSHGCRKWTDRLPSIGQEKRRQALLGSTLHPSPFNPQRSCDSAKADDGQDHRENPRAPLEHRRITSCDTLAGRLRLASRRRNPVLRYPTRASQSAFGPLRFRPSPSQEQTTMT